MARLTIVIALVGCGASAPVTRQDGPPAKLSAEAASVRLGLPSAGCVELGRVEGRDGSGHGGPFYTDGTRERAELAVKAAVASLHGNLVRIDEVEETSDRWINSTSMVHFPYVTLKGVAFSCH